MFTGNKIKSFITFIVLSFVAVLSGIFWYQWSLSPLPSGQSKPGTFLISNNESALSILLRLENDHYIRSTLAARIYLKFTGKDKKFIPGGYLLSPGLSTPSVLEKLFHGPEDIWVTIPEGLRREQIAARFASALSGPTSKFSLTEFLKNTVDLEGQLFPDTYLVPSAASVSDVISLLKKTFIRKTSLNLESASPSSGSGLSDRQVLIIASMVEREAKQAADRPVIAGIVKKRLQAGWPLQIDATVQYAQDTRNCSGDIARCQWWKPVDNTKFPSSYNTYLNPGLPPSPICNPGLASITAARNPADTPYWYYLTGSDGVTYYARTLTEHQQNIDKYLKP